MSDDLDALLAPAKPQKEQRAPAVDDLDALLAPQAAAPAAAAPTPDQIPGVRRQPSWRPEADPADTYWGHAQALLSMITGAAAPIISGANTAAGAVMKAAAGHSAREVAEDAINRYRAGRDALTYVPHEQAGREAMQSMAQNIDATKLATPLPEVAMISAAAPSAGELLPGAKNAAQTAGGAIKYEAQDFASHLPTAPRVAAPLSAQTALDTGAAPAALKVSGPMRKAAQVLVDAGGGDPEAVIAKLRAAQPATPGSLPPTTGNILGRQAAGAEKAMRADNDVQQILYDSDLARIKAQVSHLRQFTATDEQLGAIESAKQTELAPWIDKERGVLNGGGQPVDAQPVLDAIQKMRQTGAGSRHGVDSALGSLEKFIKSRNVAPQVPGVERVEVLPGVLDGVRQNAASFIEDAGQRSQGAVALGPVKNAITDTIEGAYPGYRDYLARYGQYAQQLNTHRAANDILGALDTGRPLVDQGTPALTFTVAKQIAKPYLEDQNGVAPELIGALKAIRDDQQASTVVANATKQSGSDTVSNLSGAGRVARLLQHGSESGFPAVAPLSKGALWVGGKLTGNPLAARKEVFAQMLADPHFAADVVEQTMTPKGSF